MTDETMTNESADMKWDAESMKIVAEYADLDKESKHLNDKRAKLRAKAERELDITPHDLQESVYQLKKLTKAESRASQAMQRKLVRANEGRQQELWSEDYNRNEKREAFKKQRAAKAAAAATGETPEQQERRLAADTAPRSDPKRGGAGKGKKKPKELPPIVDDQRAVAPAKPTGTRPTEAELSAAAADAPGAHDDEQAEGDAILKAMAPATEAAKSGNKPEI